MKVYLTSMSQGGAEQDIREMVQPLLPHIDGTIWVMHDAKANDRGVDFLEHNGGHVIHRHFVHRHDYSMNETLFCGLIEEGDLIVWSDVLEHPSPEFVSKIKGDYDPFMRAHGVDCLYYAGKAFLFRYHDGLRYVGSPHWGLQGVRAGLELSTMYPDDSKVRRNMRPLKRLDPYEWVTHYLRYWICYPAGSNHALLGLEKQGDPATLFPIREQRRLDFRREMRKRGYKLTVDEFIAMCRAGLDNALKEHLRGEKVLSDAYHYLVLGDERVVHSHDPKDALPIL